ncbi:glycosyltransferase family 4 protein [Thorsellia kenyensis]|uniref:Glycosyltransferase family 4 protein n=1 Tax=Thorsellia kenyensis TaxID=1549888 RepID=A0ABV6C9H5_9GAMM
MNIAIVVTKLTLSGGMERYSLDLIKGLNEKGIMPFVLTSRFDKKLLSLVDFKPIIINRPKILGKLGIHFFNFKLNYYKRKYHIDLLVACNRNTSSEIAICGGTHIGFLKAINKKPKIWDKIEIALEKRMYSKAKYIIAHSNLMAAELKELYKIEESKVKVIYPPINNNVFHPINDDDRKSIRQQNNWSDGDIILLFPSSGHERKGLPYIISSIKKSSNRDKIKLIVLGKYNSKYKEDFVLFHDFRSDIESLYQAADFTVLASVYEPFGLVGPESVLCATPCLFSENIGATEVLSHTSCHIFSVTNEENSLCKVLDNLEQLRIRIENQNSHIRYDISLSSHSQKLIELLFNKKVN